LISNIIKNNRKPLDSYTSIKQIWENEGSNFEKTTRLTAYLSEEQMNINILVSLFEGDVNALQNVENATLRTSIAYQIFGEDAAKLATLLNMSNQ